MRTLSLVVSLLCLFTVNTVTAQIKSADAFFKRFQILRTSDGKLVAIRDRTLPMRFTVAPYVELVKSQILKEQALMNQSKLTDGSYESEIRNLFKEDFDQDFSDNKNQYEENIQIVMDSMKQLALLNINYIFSHDLFKDIVKKYEEKMTNAIMLLNPSIIADVTDPTFFYKRNVTYQIVTWGLDFARKKMTNIPMLNTISHIIVEVEKRITERREFHQNMLLHYLENFKEQELGLTHDEVNMIWSSIYESRIPWFAFWESNNAKNNWLKYGVNNFYLNYRIASTNLKNSQIIYSSVNDRIDYAFQKVTFNNERVIVNLFDKENIFQNRPAVAFNYDRPTLIARKRIVFSLAELGLSFLPLNATLKDLAGSFIKSLYVRHKITEGALYGYFESTGDSKGKEQIRAQYLNPFDGLVF